MQPYFFNYASQTKRNCNRDLTGLLLRDKGSGEAQQTRIDDATLDDGRIVEARP